MSEFEISDSTNNGRIAAIRWDILPWAVVLDLDAPVSEGADVLARRVWLVFIDLDQICFSKPQGLPVAPDVETPGFRLPNGVRSTGDLYVNRKSEKTCEFGFTADFARYDEADQLVEGGHRAVKIIAKSLIGVCSVAQDALDDHGSFSYEQRNSLASDLDLLVRVNRELAGL